MKSDSRTSGIISNCILLSSSKIKEMFLFCVHYIVEFSNPSNYEFKKYRFQTNLNIINTRSVYNLFALLGRKPTFFTYSLTLFSTLIVIQIIFKYIYTKQINLQGYIFLYLFLRRFFSLFATSADLWSPVRRYWSQ